jgi:hypothetical protein
MLNEYSFLVIIILEQFLDVKLTYSKTPLVTTNM